jgi:phi13 family phage major tail protein
MKQAEFRGCDSFVAAKITKDDKTGYTTGSVIEIAPIASVAKTSEVSSETHFYDNTGLIQIKAVGVDTVTLIVPAMFLEKLAIVTGAYIDPLTGAYMSGEDSDDEYAVGYRLKLTDGSYRYVWRLKGTFNIPDETVATENDGTDSNNQELTFTGISTTHAFTKGGACKGIVVDGRKNKVDVATFFETIQTPDTVKAKA